MSTLTPNAGRAATETQERGSDYAKLSRLIKAEGLLDRRRGYYTAKLSANAALFGAGIALFVILGNSWWQLFTAAYFAMVFAQFAFMGHDAGHKQVFATKRANDAVGITHGALVGLNYRWWVGKHNQHHANPNHEDEDPDLEIPVLAFSHDQAIEKRGVSRWITKYQAFLFFPLLTLEAVMLHIASVQAVYKGETKTPRIEGTLLVLHAAAYFAAIFLVLSPLQGIVFIVVHRAILGIWLGCSFAPNHKGMPMMDGEHKADFLRKQVLTSRNVRGSKVVDFVLGGLNYQIEHHLFPSMPRPNLRRAQRHVQEFCERHHIPYTQAGVVSSYSQVIRHLHEVSAPLRARTAAAA